MGGWSWQIQKKIIKYIFDIRWGQTTFLLRKFYIFWRNYQINVFFTYIFSDFYSILHVIVGFYKTKMINCYYWLFFICEAPQKISTIFWPFLAISTLFHTKKTHFGQKAASWHKIKEKRLHLKFNFTTRTLSIYLSTPFLKLGNGNRLTLVLLLHISTF